jgi:hypothetical protein
MYKLISVGLPETLSTITCSRGMLGTFIVSEVVYSRSKVVQFKRLIPELYCRTSAMPNWV